MDTAEDAPDVPEPDDKDWTWAITRPCPECGFDPGTVEASGLGASFRTAGAAWAQVLQRPDVRDRPAPAVWSPLEYAAHVADVLVLFTGRAHAMLTTEDPQFENWDQDRTAIEMRYWEADPAALTDDIAAGSAAMADLLDQVDDDQWDRPGRRSNGSVFTVATLGVYGLHDVVHHLHDVGGVTGPSTVGSA